MNLNLFNPIFAFAGNRGFNPQMHRLVESTDSIKLQCFNLKGSSFTYLKGELIQRNVTFPQTILIESIAGGLIWNVVWSGINAKKSTIAPQVHSDPINQVFSFTLAFPDSFEIYTLYLKDLSNPVLFFNESRVDYNTKDPQSRITHARCSWIK